MYTLYTSKENENHMSVVRTCRLEEAVNEELEIIAKKNNRKISFLINEAIKDYLLKISRNSISKDE